jgi:hypothetical protein
VYPAGFTGATMSAVTRSIPCAPGSEWPKYWQLQDHGYLTAMDVDSTNGYLLLGMIIV